MRRLLFLLPLSAILLASCSTKFFEKFKPDNIIDNWGVTDDSHTFGEYDSLYYLLNPAGDVNDSIYYNGNYNDSYYHSDSMRVMLRYTCSDSISFNLDREYAVQVNPRHLIMTVKSGEDTSKRECTLRLVRDVNFGNIYHCGPDSMFRAMLEAGNVMRIHATNGDASYESPGSQNYEFTINPAGFVKAFSLADSLNAAEKAAALKAKEAAALKAKEAAVKTKEADNKEKNQADSTHRKPETKIKH